MFKFLKAAPNQRRSPRFSAAWIALLYIIPAGAWVLLSDRWMTEVVNDTVPAEVAHTVKGLLFVVFSGSLLYLLMGRAFRRTAESEHKDHLSKLPNRPAFLEEVRQRCDRLTSPEHRFSVTIIDIDRFADLNDSNGHVKGDAVLTLLSRLLAEVSGPAWYVARLGGDEFGLLSPVNADPEAMLASIDTIRGCITAESEDVLLSSLTLSAGTSYFPDHGKNSADLMRHADMALMAAKSGGRARHNLYNEHLKRAFVDRVSLVQDLKAACDNGDFDLVYQLVWSTVTHSWEGAEVLVRWNHPVRGPLSPAVFIPLAEKEGLISSITEWVVGQALRELAEADISRTLLPHLSINLSHNVLIDSGAMDRLLNLIPHERNRIPQLVMEITETSAVEGLDSALEAIQHWRHKGIEFSIDDFGTGYSSLSRLRDMEVTELKIDRRFIHELPGNKNDVAMTKAILAMADALSLRTVAEGVETAEQADFLAACGCQLLQGFHLAKPMPVVALRETLRFGPPLASPTPPIIPRTRH